MALLGLLLPLLFLLFGFGEIIRFKSYFVVGIGFIDVLILLIVIIWLIFIKKTKYKLLIPFIFFSSMAVVSLIININSYTQNQLIISSLYLFRFITYSMLYFVFVDIGKKYKEVIPKYMFLGGSIILTFGYVQFFLFRNLREFAYLGWDFHLNRLFSTFFDPNFTGAFLTLLFFFVLIMRKEIFSEKWLNFSYLFLFLNLIAIILTFSRGAYLMLVFSVITYSLFTRRWLLTAGVIVTIIIFFIIIIPSFGNESTNLLRHASVKSRVISVEKAINIWEQKPLGVGFNSYRYARDKYEDNVERSIVVSHAGAGVDNSYVFVLVTTGIFGILAFIYLILGIFKLGYKNIKSNKIALVLVVSMVGLAVNALTINSLFYSFIMIWIFILIGFTESTLRE